MMFHIILYEFLIVLYEFLIFRYEFPIFLYESLIFLYDFRICRKTSKYTSGTLSALKPELPHCFLDPALIETRPYQDFLQGYLRLYKISRSMTMPRQILEATLACER